METVGIEPTPVCLQGSLAALGTCVPITNQLRKSDSNRRGAAYETAWGTIPFRSDQGGSRTHKQQALDLTAMPVRVPGRSVVTVGVEPTPGGF